MQSAVWEQRPFASRLSQPLTTLCVCLFFSPFLSPLSFSFSFSFSLFLFPILLPWIRREKWTGEGEKGAGGGGGKKGAGGNADQKKKRKSERKGEWEREREKERKRKREKERERKERLNQLEQISQSHKSIDAIAAPRPSAGKVQVSHGVSLALVSLMKRQ